MDRYRTQTTDIVKLFVEIRRENAWYEGSIAQTTAEEQIDYIVEFTTPNLESSSSFFEEIMSESIIRPRSQCKCPPDTIYEVFQEVEALCNGGWWSGVVLKKSFHGADMFYDVFIPDLEEDILYKAIDLRKKMEWIKGKWVSAEQVAKNEGKGYSMFGEGKQVEVRRHGQNNRVSWYAATVLKMIGKTHFLVEYTTSNRSNNTSSSLQEVIDVRHIRPCPPVLEWTGFWVGDIIEVLHEGGWISGLILVILSKDGYLVKIDSNDNEEEAKVCQHTSMRPCSIWSDDHWKLISQHKDVEKYGSSSSSSKEKKSALDPKEKKIALHSNGKKNARPESNESLVKSSTNAKKRKIDTTSDKIFSQDDYLRPNKKSSCRPEYDCNMSRKLPWNDIDTSQSSVASNWERENVVRSPFSIMEKDEMIKLVESTNEVFGLFPQDPHFRPLLKHDETLRKGLAYGLLMSFAGLVTVMRSYTVDTSWKEIEKTLKSLDCFIEYGFDVQPMQTYLNRLMTLHRHLDELKDQKKSTMEELEEAEQKKRRDGSLISDIEDNINALFQQRETVLLKMKKRDAKAVHLHSVSRTIEDDIIITKTQLCAHLPAPG